MLKESAYRGRCWVYMESWDSSSWPFSPSTGDPYIVVSTATKTFVCLWLLRTKIPSMELLRLSAKRSDQYWQHLQQWHWVSGSSRIPLNLMHWHNGTTILSLKRSKDKCTTSTTGRPSTCLGTPRLGFMRQFLREMSPITFLPTLPSYYETGRDFLSMNQYVTPNVQRIQSMFLRHQQNITSTILGNSDLSQVFNNLNSLTVAATPMEWTFMDGRPFKDPVLLAPSQVGLIYMIIITFFSFNFFSDIHQSVAKMGIKIPHLVLYRILSAILSFFVISFFYSLVTLVFQVDFTRTFGHSGFIVYWMTNFLTMWAVGAMNEAMGMVFIMLYPPLLGFWMLFWVIVNISPTFAPLALSAKFFRYGYGMPIHASYEITKVIFFNTYKGALGRNYGILVAWCVIASVLLLVVFKKFGQVMGGRAAAQRAQIEKELNEKRARDEEGEIDFS